MIEPCSKLFPTQYFCLSRLAYKSILQKHTKMASEQPYQVVMQQSDYAVVDSSKRTVVTCRNEHNAQHYAELLNRAYERGYKAGYKAGKSSVD